MYRVTVKTPRAAVVQAAALNSKQQRWIVKLFLGKTAEFAGVGTAVVHRPARYVLLSPSPKIANFSLASFNVVFFCVFLSCFNFLFF